jgi:hypothetical protein
MSALELHNGPKSDIAPCPKSASSKTSTGYSITSSAIGNKRWRNGDREPSQASGFELAKIDLRRSIAAIVTAISCLSFRVDVQN